jgi:hypothetical protein
MASPCSRTRLRSRDEFGGEMMLLARERMRAARERGPRAVLGESFTLAFDLLRSVPGQWLFAARDRRPSSFTNPPADPASPRDNMDIFIQDLRFGARGLLRRPGFTIVAALTLALGIGANTAIFSVVNALLIRPLPYPNANRMVMIYGTQGAQGQQGVVYADYHEWRAQNRTFDDMGVFAGRA